MVRWWWLEYARNSAFTKPFGLGSDVFGLIVLVVGEGALDDLLATLKDFGA